MFSLVLISLSDRHEAARNVSYPHVMSDTQGVVNLKTTSHLFSQVLGCHSPLHTLTLLCKTDHQHLKQWSTFCLSSWPFQITQHKRWNVAAATRTGHTEDSYGFGGYRGAPFASPLTVCPPPLWPLDNEPFWGLCKDQHSHLTPGLTLCLTGV